MWGGIQIRKDGNDAVIEARLVDDVGGLLVGGTTTAKVFEVQADGTLESYDFDDDTFKTGALTTATLSLTHRKGNNGTQDTGLWTGVISPNTAFTIGMKYRVLIENASMSPPAVLSDPIPYGGADVAALNGDVSAAQDLAASASTIYRGTVDSGTTTTLVDDGLTQSATDFWKGRIVIFTSGALAGQATDITGFAPASDELTFTALTGAPSNGDTYVIV